MKKRDLEKRDMYIFVGIVVVGIFLYFVIFGSRERGLNVAESPKNSEPYQAITGPVNSEAGAEVSDKTKFEWQDRDLVGSSPANDSTLSGPGGDVKALYQKVDNKYFYSRLQLFENVNPSFVYYFFLNLDRGVYQIFASTTSVNFFFHNSSSNKAIALNSNLVEVYMNSSSKNIELRVPYKQIGLTEGEALKIHTMISVSEFRNQKLFREDSAQIKNYYR